MNHTAPLPIDHLPLLHALKVSARVAVGFVWLWEGLVPKILRVTPVEIEMIERSGLWWGSPEATLQWLGIAMIVAGVILMIGWLERLGQFVATASVLVLMVLVIRNSPGAWHDPYGGLAKDACLFSCSAVVWFLSPITNRRPPGCRANHRNP